jgi:hypothetical protein
MGHGQLAPAISVLAIACATRPPASTAGDDTTKSPLIEETTVGKHRCPTADGEIRPFVVEWDATDLADFEARAARDIVFVELQACTLKVLTRCVDQSVRGKYGAYRAPQWTSGGVESFEIEDETKLFTELPLGAVSLAGHVRRGERLRLRYFVSGVTDATRSAVHHAELADNPHCKGATHFVHSYNLGAFELGSTRHRSEGGSAKVLSAGAGAEHRRDVDVLKRIGVLESCRGESAKDTLTCRVPIRLDLRPLAPGMPPDAPAPAAATAPANPTTQDMLTAGKLRNEALSKLTRGDGAGCLRDLERAREIDPDTDHIQGQLWAQCTMRAGKCDAGRRLLRRYYETELGMQPDAVDPLVEAQQKTHCPAK